MSTALTGQITGLPAVHSSRTAFANGRALPVSTSSLHSSRRAAARTIVRAATRQQRAQPEDDDEEKAGPIFDLRSLFGGGGRQTEPESAERQAPGRGGTSVRKARPGTARVGGGAKQRGGTTKVGVRKERLGTQRVKRPGRIGGGTMRIGGRAGGTTVIGARKKDAGPRGLFGGRSGRRDTQLVFVAGGTGRLGARIVRQLLLQGLKVRVGVRSKAKAQAYLDTAVAYGLLPRGAERRVQIVEYDITDPETIPAAIGSAAKMVSAIGAAEALDFGAPKKVDGEGGINLVNAAKAAGVQHFIMVTSLGTGKFGWPAGILNLFGGVLIFKKKAEEALEASGMRYTIVRPGGMERPGDDFKATHNVTIKPRDTTFGGQISRLQVAEVVGTSIARTELAENKVLELVAETTAPQREIELLLADAPQEAPQEARAATASAIEEAEEMLETAQEEQQFLRDEYADTQARLAELAQEEEDAPNARAMQRVTRSIQETERQLAMLEEAAEQAQRQEAAAKAVLKAAQQARAKREALSPEEVQRIQNDILFPPTPEEIQERREAEQRAKEEAAAAERAERERQADEARQAREAAAAEQRRAAEEKAAKAKAEADAKRKAEEERRQAEADARAKAQAEAQAQREKEQQEREAAKAKADAEAKAKREAEEKKREDARAKAEAEAKAKKEEEEKAKAEAKAKADAEAKKQKEEAEAEAKAKADADAKAKKDAEAKAKQEADAKAKADADAKAKADADAKAKADADAQAKADADAKVKQQAEAKGAVDDTAAAAAEQAKKSAAEARAWIQNWRDNGVQFAEEVTEEAAQQTSGLFGGFKWPWQRQQQQQKEQQQQEEEKGQQQSAAEQPQQQAAPASGGDAGMEADVEGAREWINNWRAKNLESKLPQDKVKAETE